MKKTRKWAFVGQEAKRLAGLGMTPLEIAHRIGVQKWTVNRWIKEGKITRGKVARPIGGSSGPMSPAAWAASVRADYALDATDEQLVTAGEMALEMAQNPAERPATRLIATARYQSIVKQLALSRFDPAPEAATPPSRRPAPKPPARSGADPRSFLQVVRGE